LIAESKGNSTVSVHGAAFFVKNTTQYVMQADAEIYDIVTLPEGAFVIPGERSLTLGAYSEKVEPDPDPLAIDLDPKDEYNINVSELTVPANCELVVNGGGQFSDVAESSWYYQAVNWAAANGVVSGISENSFAPDMNLTREQLVTLLYRYCILNEIDVSVGDDTNILSYEDAFSVSEYAISAMQWACGAGVITGKPGGLLDPKGNATRAEFAAVMYRFITAEE
jgi:hypothetical protein